MATDNGDGASKPDSKWNEDSHATLCGALAVALQASGASLGSHKEMIHGALLAKGYNFTWEAVR